MDQHSSDHQPAESGPRDQQATPELLESAYEELKALAASYMSHERAGHTLQPTALVHEAFLRLSDLDRIAWRDRTHFMAAAAGAIRRVLVDHARKRDAVKRGGGRKRLALTGVDLLSDHDLIDVIALNDALGRLEQLDERKGRVVELRYFGGLTIVQTAGTLGISETTVEDDWAFARAWLRRELGGSVES